DGMTRPEIGGARHAARIHPAAPLDVVADPARRAARPRQPPAARSAVQVDGHVVLRAAQRARQADVGRQPRQPARLGRDDHLVEMRVAGDDGSRRRLHQIAEMRVWVTPAKRANDRGREDDVADEAQPDEQNLHSVSMVASSISMTGMSSLMGYTRWHWPHFSAAPFLTRVTGVLQFGQARISSNSGSSAIHPPQTRTITSRIKLLLMALHRLVASVLVVGSLAVAAPPAFAQTDSDSYFEFLMARRLEGTGDFAGAQAALDRAVQASPASAELRGQVASFYLRRSQPDEAEKSAKAGLAIDENNTEAHRALGLVYAGYADAGTGARANSPEIRTYLNDAITHLERAAAGAATGDLVLHFTLGRLYLRLDQAGKAVDSLNRVVSLNPGSLQARLALAQ